MKTGIEKNTERTPGFTLRRLVATLLVLAQCLSLAFVGAPVAYAEDLETSDAVHTELAYSPDGDEEEPEDFDEPGDYEEPELPPEGGELEAALGDGLLVSLSFEADAGIPADAVLSLRADPILPAADGEEEPALGLSEYERARYDARQREALEITEEDLVFDAQLLEISILSDGERVIPMRPVEVCIRFPMAPSARVETYAAVRFDETGAFGVEENTEVMTSSSGMEDGLCTLRFTSSDLALFGICSYARRQLTLQTPYAELAIYAPDCASVDPEAVSAVPAFGTRVLEAYAFNANSPAPEGATALWLTSVCHAPAQVQPVLLYALEGREATALLSADGGTQRPVYLGHATGIALLTPETEVTLYSSDTLTVVGAPVAGLSVEAEDVSDSFSDYDFSDFVSVNDEPLPLILQVVPGEHLFAGWRRAIEAVQSMVQAQSAQAEPAVPTWYELVGAYQISLTMDGEDELDEAESPLRVSVTNPAIDEATEIQLWLLRDGVREQVDDFTVEGSTVSFETAGSCVCVITRTVIEETVETSDGKTYKVSVSYDSLSGIPEDAALIVREILPGEEGYDEYVAKAAQALGKTPENLDFARPFDISLQNPYTGEICQPGRDVQVSVELLDDALSGYADVSVVHFHGGSEDQIAVMDSSVEGEAVAFETNGFSVYVIIGHDAKPRRTYLFYIWKNDIWDDYIFTTDTGVETSRQTVRNGQKPVVPNPIPSRDGEEFAGWYEKKIENNQVTEDFADEPYDFDTEITEDEVIGLYAVFKSYLYVVFHDQYNEESDSFPIAEKRRGEKNSENKATIKISDVSATYSGGSDMAFFGWSETPITDPKSGYDVDGNPVKKYEFDEIEISAEKHLYPIFKPVKWLSFWSGPTGSGATYFPTKYYFEGLVPAAEIQPLIPERSGYTFLGWYPGKIEAGEVVYDTDPITYPSGGLIPNAAGGGMQVVGDTLKLSSETTLVFTLYAKWQKSQDTVKYNIVIWKQKTTDPDGLADSDKHYDFAEAVEKTADIGATVSVDEEYKQRTYTGFTFNRCDAAVTVDPDGYTILNVYYDKNSGTVTGNVHTLEFRDSVMGTGACEGLPKTYDNVAYETGLLNGNNGESFVPSDPTSGRKGYSFSGWYADQGCSVRVFFDEDSYNKYSYSKVLYATMPNDDLTIYAGWSAEWYLVRIDPNYGDFHGSGSTWTWKTVESDLIQEYTQVTRDYAESSSGEYYYVKHDRAYYGYTGVEWDNSEPERGAYYTLEPGEATEYKTFEYAPGVYSYAGWYEVLKDGTEKPYDFTKHVDHHTLIRLHWKKDGNFYLKYDAGEGTLDSGGKEYDDPTKYADNAEIVLTRSATAPTGYTFAGWRVEGDSSGTVYRSGASFILQSDYAVSISGRDTVTLEAVYVKLGTASIVYDFNGGTVTGAFNYGEPEESGAPTIGTEITDKKATVSNIVNNSGFYLSNGTGLTMANAVLKGWSNKKVYSENDPEAQFYELGFVNDEERAAKKGLYGVDTEEPIKLYAVWEVKVTYHLNSSTAQWAGDWSGYTFDSGTNTYSQSVYTGNVISEPVGIPGFTGTGKMFFSWVDATDSSTAHDFSQQVSGALDLYAFWRDPIEVPVQAVDASVQSLSKKAGWVSTTVNKIPVLAADVDIDAAMAETYVTNLPADYEYAFAVALGRTATLTRENVLEENAVTAVYYNQSAKHLYVKFADTTKADAILDDNSEIYFVFYQKKARDILYKSMPASGELVNVTGLNQNAPSSTGTDPTDLLGTYDMASQVTQPLGWVSDSTLTNYAYAIGSADATNASGLSLITTASNSDTSRPTLEIRNTWHGFEYTTDHTVWIDCGYDPTLFVVYYELQPTVVMFHEQTVGLYSVMNTAFTFNLLVTETSTNAQKQTRDGAGWVDDGAPGDYTTTVFDTAQSPNVPYSLKNGEANSAILFYSVPAADTVLFEESGSYRYIATADSVTTQTAVITQTANAGFTTFIDGVEQTAEPYSYTAGSEPSGGTKNVVFTNKHKATEVEIHVARIENGAVNLRDNLRGSSEATYKFSLNADTENYVKLLTELPAATVYTDTDGVYAFGAAVFGSDDGTAVTVHQMGVESLKYASVQDNLYGLLMKDGDGKLLGELGSYKLYYLYYPMPKIQYYKQAGTTYSLIEGATAGKITYGGAELQMNGQTVVQNQRITLPFSGLLISQESSSTSFKMPPILDDGTFQRYLSYTGLGVGPGISSDATEISSACVMHLKIDSNQLKWSFDGENWKNLGDNIIFAVYTERGYDLQISKVVNVTGVKPDESRKYPIFTEKEFTVTIEPASGNTFNKTAYAIEGYSSQTVPVENGKITLTVKDGTRVKLLGLGHGNYTVSESSNENFSLSAKTGPIVGTASNELTVTANSSVNLPLTTETQLVLTNTPKPICIVRDAPDPNVNPFYTLKDAVSYMVNANYLTANIEMLTDYLMPADDTMQIPSNLNITLTTATTGAYQYDGTGTAVITRSAELTTAPMITNSGTLKIVNLTLDGASVEANAPMIRSTGELTVQAGTGGTVLKNAVNAAADGVTNSGDGGAIYATGTVDFVLENEDETLTLQNNRAVNGGLLYYAGTGAVTISGGSFGGSSAPNIAENGGAIYAVGGTVTVSGGSFSYNRATVGSGGAIHTEYAAVAVNGATLQSNSAAANGGAVYTASGAVTVSGGSVTGNTATNGSGGAVYTASGAVTVSGGSVSANTAKVDGGAIYAGTGAVTVSGGSVGGNKATNGNGGAIYAGTGAVTVSGGTVGGTGNTAQKGGAIYAGTGAVAISGGSVYANKAATDGGAVYADSGSVTISGAATAIYSNEATNGNGGAVYAASGAVTLSEAKLYTNTATSGKGGAIYVDSGSVTVSSGVIGGDNGGNRAINGAGVFVNTGSASFTAGLIKKNIASAGGAVGVGSASARLDFSGTATVQDNTLGEGTGAPASNVYLDQDSEMVINTAGMSGGYVGIYVPGDEDAELFINRGGIGAEFGICSGEATTITQFHNDRDANLKAVVNSITKRIYWSSGIKVRVRYLPDYSSLPTGSNGDSKYSKSNYYPTAGNAAISLLADELRSSVSNLSSTAVYATAMLQSDSSYDHYLTKLLWEGGKWKVERRDGAKVDVGTKEIIIYYTEPTYLTIDNNTAFDFEISSLSVNLAGADRSLLNSATLTGFGLVFARNGTIQNELLPVSVNTAGKLVLPANGGSINILIPGGASHSFSLTGDFVGGSGEVQLRCTGQTATTIWADATVSLGGTTAAASSTYEIIFGDDKAICKIWCATQSSAIPSEYVEKYEHTNGTTEYTFSKMTKAVAFAKNHNLKSITIEMLVDYLMPEEDVVAIATADAFQLVGFTTALSGEYQYPGTDSTRRATISRGIGNEEPLINVAGTVGTTGGDTETRVNVHDLDFDGKNLVGECEGGAVKTKDCKVEIENVKFVNFTAYNGGAIFISYGTTNEKQTSGNKNYTFAANYDPTNATLTVENVTATNCTAKFKFGRSGGGAIWTNAKTFTLNNSVFTNCISDGSNMQGGAVFHRIEAFKRAGANLDVTPYYAQSKTICNDCQFIGCKAQAGGALESDSTNIQLKKCDFTNCSTTAKDGGALNVYIFEQVSDMTYNSIPSKLYLEGCEFIGCTSARNGGAVRSMAVDNAFVDCTFTNTTATGNGKGGGAIYVSNNRSVTTTVTGCTFTGTKSNNGPGGAICTYSKELRVSGTKINNCESKNSSGGGIYHAVTSASYDGAVNNVGSFASLTDCTITGCTASKRGGGLYTNAFNKRTVASTEEATYDINAVATSPDEAVQLLNNCTIKKCTATTEYGGGVYLDSGDLYFATVISSTLEGCTSAWSGAGLYSKARYLTVSGSTFKGCTSGAKGGGVFQSKSGATIAFTDSTIDGCTSAESGGGLYSDSASAATYTNTTVSGNTATGSTATANGGGIYHGNGVLTFTNSAISGNKAPNGSGGGVYHVPSNANLTFDTCTVSGNSAGSMGGGVYCGINNNNNDLTLINTIVRENKLGNDTVDNAAGVYMTNNGKLVVGTVTQEGDKKLDYSAVMNNTTDNGADSNLRMPINTSGAQINENKNCVKINRGLGKNAQGEGGYIGVTNAWKVGTQFGLFMPNVNSNIDPNNPPDYPPGLMDPDGVEVLDAVFNADTSTLYGIIDRSDQFRRKVIWAGPPICKITDANGKLLYFKDNGTDPAIFDVLDDGTNRDGTAQNRTSAFSMLRAVLTNVDKVRLYYAPEEGSTTGAQYKGGDYVVKMLVEEYELTNQITTVDAVTRGTDANQVTLSITLTTAGKSDNDGYPFDKDATGNRATITRGATVTGSMAAPRTNMVFRNILLDGGNTASTEAGAIVRVTGTKENTVELLSDAILQYGKAPNGGAVAVTNGSFTVNGGLIRFCEATENGGGVYMASTANTTPEKGFRFLAGNIQGCKAENGGGVYLAEGAFNMSGGTISGCSASASGGGVFVADAKTMNMSGGYIGYSAANTAVLHGGGIAIGGKDTRLHFSKQVNISKNTCTASLADGKLCNLELLDTEDAAYNSVINSNGLYSRSYIGVYVPGDRDDEHPENDGSPYREHGGERDPFGSFTGSSSTLYCYVNDRNGLKGGLIANPAPETIYWIKIFSIDVSKKVTASENVTDDAKQAAKDAEFVFTVQLMDTPDNVSGIQVKDIAADIQAAQAAGEESKFGDIPFKGDGSVIEATITLKDGENITAQNLPAGLQYSVTEHWTDGYCNIPSDLTKPINIQSGKTGENMTVEGVDHYTSFVKFDNIQVVCKVTDGNGGLLYRNAISSGQTPAVYTELSEAFEAVNYNRLYEEGAGPIDIHYQGEIGGYRIEMVQPTYFQTGMLSLTNGAALTLTTADANATDHFPFDGSGVAAIKRAGSFDAGSMLTLSGNSDLTLTNVRLDGNKVEATVEKGGLVYAPVGAKLTVTDGAQLQNSRITGDGAGVYLEYDKDLNKGATLYLSGNPLFSGQDVDAYGAIKNESANYKRERLTGKYNGTKVYLYAHQDIYLEEKNDGAPKSIVITGDLSAQEGSIWVWAVEPEHYEQLMPFAVPDTGVVFDENNYDPEHLKVFRNAQPDDVTSNRTGAYLYGTLNEEDFPGYICWNGVKGTREVVLRKVVAGSQTSLGNATFNVFKGSSTAHYQVARTDQSGATVMETLENLSSDATSGVFWAGELPFGTYYVHEITVPDSVVKSTAQDGSWWYTLEISETGVTCSAQSPTDPLGLNRY